MTIDCDHVPNASSASQADFISLVQAHKGCAPLRVALLGSGQNTNLTCAHILRMPLSVKSRFRNWPAGVPTTFLAGI